MRGKSGERLFLTVSGNIGRDLCKTGRSTAATQQNRGDTGFFGICAKCLVLKLEHVLFCQEIAGIHVVSNGSAAGADKTAVDGTVVICAAVLGRIIISIVIVEKQMTGQTVWAVIIFSGASCAKFGIDGCIPIQAGIYGNKHPIGVCFMQFFECGLIAGRELSQLRLKAGIGRRTPHAVHRPKHLIQLVHNCLLAFQLCTQFFVNFLFRLGLFLGRLYLLSFRHLGLFLTIRLSRVRCYIGFAGDGRFFCSRIVILGIFLRLGIFRLGLAFGRRFGGLLRIWGIISGRGICGRFICSGLLVLGRFRPFRCCRRGIFCGVFSRGRSDSSTILRQTSVRGENREGKELRQHYDCQKGGQDSGQSTFFHIVLRCDK